MSNVCPYSKESARAQDRLQRAVSAGLDVAQVMRLPKPFIKDLSGDGAVNPDLLNSIGPQIDSGIAN